MTKVAFQGEKGAYSEIASKKLFGEKISTSPSFSFDEVFRKVKNGDVNFGIIPVENSLTGIIFETYDLLLKYSLTIVGEANLKINHQLISNKNYKLNQIKKIYSHPQALSQCSEFIKSLKNAEPVPAYDTAGSALLFKDEKHEAIAAIASMEAAKLYNLKILKRDIQNNKENFTRFLAISKKKINRKFGKPKTSICFELKNMTGVLFKALSVFALRDIDLLKIESRPIPHKPFEYIFYVDLVGSLEDSKIKLALNHLSEISISITKFGTYDAGNTYKS